MSTQFFWFHIDEAQATTLQLLHVGKIQRLVQLITDLNVSQQQIHLFNIFG